MTVIPRLSRRPNGRTLDDPLSDAECSLSTSTHLTRASVQAIENRGVNVEK